MALISERFKALERSIAKQSAVSIIESNCIKEGRWWTLRGIDGYAAAGVKRALRYLRELGLVEDHRREELTFRIRRSA